MAMVSKQKIENAIDRGYFRTFDLFAGCGGMSLGFHRAGFKSVGAVEIKDEARKSHEANFSGKTTHDSYKAFGDILATPLQSSGASHWAYYHHR